MGVQFEYAHPTYGGFLGGSAGKESACNAGDLGSIPGLGRSPGERNSYLVGQRHWASLVAQLVKNPPAMQETWVRSLVEELRSHMLHHQKIKT